MSEPPSFLRLNTVLLCGRTIFFIHPPVGTGRYLVGGGDVHDKCTEYPVITQIVRSNFCEITHRKVLEER